MLRLTSQQFYHDAPERIYGAKRLVYIEEISPALADPVVSVTVDVLFCHLDLVKANNRLIQYDIWSV